MTGLPILLTPVVEAVRGQPGSWGVTVPMGSLTLALLGLLTWLLSTMRRPGISAFMKPAD